MCTKELYRRALEYPAGLDTEALTPLGNVSGLERRSLLKFPAAYFGYTSFTNC